MAVVLTIAARQQTTPAVMSLPSSKERKNDSEETEI
jgi:hypothetical protein